MTAGLIVPPLILLAFLGEQVLRLVCPFLGLVGGFLGPFGSLACLLSRLPQPSGAVPATW
jgi:hypothetical protein